MTKRELVMNVAEKLGMTQNEVSDIVQETLQAITEALVEGSRIEIRNFGVFEVKTRDARIGRNPRTGQEVPIPTKRVASFRPGKSLKEWVQAGPDYDPGPLFGGDEADEASASSDDHGPSSASSSQWATPGPAGSAEREQNRDTGTGGHHGGA